jgi:adenylate kinase
MIVLTGMAGSGKTTQAAALGKLLGCPFFSMGELLRQHGNADIQAKMQAGVIVPNAELAPILERALAAHDVTHQEIITDGFPRSLEQAEWLMGQITAGKVKFTAMVHLVVPEEVAAERLAGRGRKDDTTTAIKKRFEEYHKEINQILELFIGHGLRVEETDGLGTVEEVTKRIVVALEGGVDAV